MKPPAPPDFSATESAALTLKAPLTVAPPARSPALDTAARRERLSGERFMKEDDRMMHGFGFCKLRSRQNGIRRRAQRLGCKREV
jgi:hypothetical protein